MKFPATQALEAFIKTEDEQSRLQEVFSQVQNPEDWRAAIDTEIDTNETSLAEVTEAVIFYTSTCPGFKHISGTKYRVRATGYRMGPAGDH